MMTKRHSNFGTAALAAVLLLIGTAGATASATYVPAAGAGSAETSTAAASAYMAPRDEAPAGVAAPAGQIPGFLKGKVHDLSSTTGSLDRKIEQARTDAAKAGGGAAYLTAYEFLSRTKFHRRNYSGPTDGYSVGTRDARIRIEDKGRGKNSVTVDGEEKETPSPAGMLLLFDGSKGAAVQDVSLLDLDQSYEFGDTPVYWLGRAENKESGAFLEKSFDALKENTHVLDSLIFAISCHEGPQARTFLKQIAIGPRPGKIREKAIFWLGNAGDSQALTDLKEIYAKEQDGSVKKQIVFAIQLSKQKDAVGELIRIAKHDSSPDVRKQAVFWLGQKASAESVKALKDIVEAPDDPAGAASESGLKEQAVFAISQLPKDKSVPMLIDLAKANKNPSVRKKAIFWLGQTGDPAALKFFEDILLKK